MTKNNKIGLILFPLLMVSSVGAYPHIYQYPDTKPATLINTELTINCISSLSEQQTIGEYDASLKLQNDTFPFRFETTSITPTEDCDGLTTYSNNILAGTVLVETELLFDLPYSYTLTFDKINEDGNYEFLAGSEDLYQIIEGVKNISSIEGNLIEIPYQGISDLADIELRYVKNDKILTAWNPVIKTDAIEFTPIEIGTFNLKLINHTTKQIDYFTVIATSSCGGATECVVPKAVQIVLNGSSISAESEQVKIVDNIATITDAGTYILTGNLDDGQIIVDTDENVTLILNGVNITSSNSSPLFIRSSKNTNIVLNAGTSNSLTDGTDYVFEDDDDEPDSAIYSKSDLTISGEGSLVINANYNDGIKSKDGLTITSGNIAVNSVDDGIQGKDYLIITNANINIEAAGDGLKSTNDNGSNVGYIAIENGNFNITAGADAIQAETSINISNGMFALTSGGGSDVNIGEEDSAKGIKANIINIANGSFSISSADDSIHANETIIIDNGEFDLSSGDDGIHADSVIKINQANINITKSYEGIESSTIIINDGTIFIIASDDGINIANGVDGSSQGNFQPLRDDNFSPQDRPDRGERPELSEQEQADREAFDQERPEQNQVNREQPDIQTQGQPNASTTDYLYINGGYIVVDSQGDGLDANGSIVMTAGSVIVNGPTSNRDGALDYDGTFDISGGYLIASGSSGMAHAPSQSSSQPSVLIKFDSSISAGTLIHIETSEGEEIVTFAPSKSSQSIIFSSAKLTNGSTYNVYSGGSSTGTATDGLYEGGTYTAGTLYTSFTISNAETTIK